MPIGTFYHIGFVVRDLDKAIARFSDVLNVRFTEPTEMLIPCLEDPIPHAQKINVVYSMTDQPYYELVEAVGDGIYSEKNTEQILYFGLWEPDMKHRLKELKRQGIGIDAYYRQDQESEPYAVITKPDLMGVRMEYVDVSLRAGINGWVLSGEWGSGGSSAKT